MERKGITRKKAKSKGKKEKIFIWNYYDPSGKLISNKNTIDRCNKLVLPPAWEDVWISTDPENNLQATGRDSRKRLQYRYHENWTKARSAKKFDGLAGFGKILPEIRKKVKLDLKLEGMPLNKVMFIQMFNIPFVPLLPALFLYAWKAKGIWNVST